MKNVYLVTRDEKSVITYNKKLALKFAKQENAAVYKLSYQYYKDCNFVMDTPTFCTVGEKIY